MNFPDPSNPPDPQDPAFEQWLSSFDAAPPPPAWRDELITQAMAADAETHPEVESIHTLPYAAPKPSRMSWPIKAGLIALAACWILIAFFRVATPDNSDVADVSKSTSTELAPSEGDMLRFVARHLRWKQELTYDLSL